MQNSVWIQKKHFIPLIYNITAYTYTYNIIIYHIILYIIPNSIIQCSHIKAYHHNPCAMYQIDSIQFFMVLYWIVMCFGRIRLLPPTRKGFPERKYLLDPFGVTWRRRFTAVTEDSLLAHFDTVPTHLRLHLMRSDSDAGLQTDLQVSSHD